MEFEPTGKKREIKRNEKRKRKEIMDNETCYAKYKIK